MKYFLPLLILTGLLFGQDVLNLKSGESFDGTFYGKVGEDIVFDSSILKKLKDHHLLYKQQASKH